VVTSSGTEIPYGLSRGGGVNAGVALGPGRGIGRGLGVANGLGGVGRTPLEKNMQVKSVCGPQSNAPAGICIVLTGTITGEVSK